jgi:hypothetical protein
VANWSANLLITVTFLSAVDALGKDVVFWIYAAFAAVGIVFVRLCVPETKGRSLEEIEDYWTRGHSWQNGNGRRRVVMGRASRRASGRSDPDEARKASDRTVASLKTNLPS